MNDYVGSHRPVLGTFDDPTQSIYCRGCRERITDIGGLCIPKNPEPPAADAEPPRRAVSQDAVGRMASAREALNEKEGA